MTTESTAPAAPAEKSLREELQEAFNAASSTSTGTSTGDDQVVDAAASSPSPSPAPAPASSGDRQRDGQGRFAGKQEAVDATIVDASQRAGAKPTEPAAAGAQGASTTATAAAAPAIAPPPNLKPELRAAWDAAPPELRKYITEREAEVHKGFTRMDEERQFGKAMRDTIAPYMATIRAEGGDPARAVGALLNTAYILRAGTPAQKVMAVQAITQQYGIPLDQIQQFQQQQRIDPNVAALQQRVEQLTQLQQRQAQERQLADEQITHTEIATFAAAPGHEYFDQVKPHMAALLEKNLATSLQDAYDQAVWARPDLRQQVLAAQQQTAEQARVTQAQARATAARQAAGSVSGTPGMTVPVAAPDRSLREELRANFAAARH